ncbi:MAG: DinB family protein [Candidatus Limnocylindrales bacterium]
MADLRSSGRADAEGGPSDPGARFALRLEAARARLAEHAAAGALAGLTGADAATGERWESSQVWGHLAEFPAYWLGQFRRLLAARAGGTPEPVPFGRSRSDPGRAAGIERGRQSDRAELHAQLEAGILDAETFVRALTPGEWQARGLHPTLGPMDLPAMLERFVVGHLEEHADQLDELAQGTA